MHLRTPFARCGEVDQHSKPRRKHIVHLRGGLAQRPLQLDTSASHSHTCIALLAARGRSVCTLSDWLRGLNVKPCAYTYLVPGLAAFALDFTDMVTEACRVGLEGASKDSSIQG